MNVAGVKPSWKEIFASLDRPGMARSTVAWIMEGDGAGYMAALAHNVLKMVRRPGRGVGPPGSVAPADAIAASAGPHRGRCGGQFRRAVVVLCLGKLVDLLPQVRATVDLLSVRRLSQRTRLWKRQLHHCTRILVSIYQPADQVSETNSLKPPVQSNIGTRFGSLNIHYVQQRQGRRQNVPLGCRSQGKCPAKYSARMSPV